MHVITTKNISFWWLYSLLFIKLIEALNITDFGLPNKNSCAFHYNQTVYIFNQEDYSLSISFGNPWNTNIPTIVRHNITLKSKTACSITRSGKIILLQQQLPPQQQQEQQPSLLQIINDITLQSSFSADSSTYLGSQNAIYTFITRPNISNFASTTFNDFVIIFGGETSNNIALQSTFLLDTRYPTQYVWYELPIALTTPPPTSNSTLYSTSRWILHFRTELNNQNSTAPSYTTFIDCFDPYGFQWLGIISSFNSSTNSIQAVPVVSSATGSDSLWIFPSWSPATQSGGETEEAIIDFWKLDISSWNPSNFNLTKLNLSLSSAMSIHRLDASFSSNPSVSNQQPPVVVTVNNNDIVLFYGGSHQPLRFFNTTKLSFAPQPQWLQDQKNSTSDDEESANKRVRNLPIILGSVIGGVLFIALIILFFWCFCFKKRQKNHYHNNLLRPNNNNNNEKPPPLSLLSSPLFSNKLGLFLLGNNKRSAKTTTTVVTRENNNKNGTVINPIIHGSSSNISQYTLSPIKPLSPIILFPLSSHHPSHSATGFAAVAAAPSSSAAADNALQDEGIVQPQQQPEAKKLMKSRFREHFDYQSFPLFRHHHDEDSVGKHVVASKSLPLESSSDIVAVGEQQQQQELSAAQNKIPRSNLSYV